MTDQLNLVRASDVGGLPVVTIGGGEDVAEIKDVVYDASRHHLVGFTLNKRGWFRGSLKSTLEVAAVAGIGADAVMVADDHAMTEKGDAPAALASPSSGHNVIGNRVVSSGGTVLGTVVDVVIETGAEPQAVGYEVETNDGTAFVPSSAQMALSGDNLVVPAEAEEFIDNDLVGFGASVSSFRQMIGDRS